MNAATSRNRFRPWHSWAGFPLALALGAWAVSIRGRDASDQNSSAPPPLRKLAGVEHERFPLEIGPDPLSLGTLRPGQSAKARFTVRNRGDEAIYIEQIEISCPCLRVAPPSARVGAGESVDLLVTFDTSEEPDFRGRLSIGIQGLDEAGKGVFSGRAKVEISDDVPTAPSQGVAERHAPPS